MKPDENTKLMSVNQKFERRYVPIFAINIVLWTVMLNRSSPAGREINYRFVGVRWASYMFVCTDFIANQTFLLSWHTYCNLHV